MTLFTGEFPKELLEEMIELGSKGPCQKSKRVSGLYFRDYNLWEIEVNQPPFPFKCSGTKECKENCNKLCIHAEENVLLTSLIRARYDFDKSECIHLKIVDGKPVTSGNPSCIYCSKALLRCKVKYMWLWQENGWKRWTTLDFHKETIANLGLNGNTIL